MQDVCTKSDIVEGAIQIGGPSIAQNQLLGSFLCENLGVPAIALASGKFTSNDTELKISLFMHDCIEMDQEKILEFIEDINKLETEVCLFNVAPKCEVEIEALTNGIRGVFYTTDTAETLVRGIKAVMGGELWFSRKTFSKCITTQVRKAAAQAPGVCNLTPRELEVLALLSMGTSNSMIAKRFCISDNTVKTHLYRIYKKIGVTNRLNAMIWASSHFSNLPLNKKY